MRFLKYWNTSEILTKLVLPWCYVLVVAWSIFPILVAPESVRMEAFVNNLIPYLISTLLLDPGYSTWFASLRFRESDCFLVDALMGFFADICGCVRRPQKADAATAEVSSNFFFKLEALQIATNFFSELNRLGHGGFGPVYKVSFIDFN